ncbi:transcription factor bHLH51-like [Henckelia pumila]|uniref:transcription factor bHLH51-like n=1 Tax=Henckelia pumila TaxID=405737 RepID=UPI003C6DE7BE
MANCYWSEEYSTWLPLGYPPASGVQGQWPRAEEDAAEDRAARSHSEAEKRRRDRINAQFSTLRKLIPKSEKMDKAALLGHVVEHVKELKKEVKEVCKHSTIPSEIDEVTIDFLDKQGTDPENVYLKASVCCDDRPELFSELSIGLKSVGLAIVQVDLTSLGGRVKGTFVLSAKGTSCSEEYLSSLRQSLKLVLSRVVVSSATTSYGARSKRQRFFWSH